MRNSAVHEVLHYNWASCTAWHALGMCGHVFPSVSPERLNSPALQPLSTPAEDRGWAGLAQQPPHLTPAVCSGRMRCQQSKVAEQAAQDASVILPLLSACASWRIACRTATVRARCTALSVGRR